MSYRKERSDAQHSTKDCSNETANLFRSRLLMAFVPSRVYQWYLLLLRHRNVALRCSDPLSKIQNKTIKMRHIFFSFLFFISLIIKVNRSIKLTHTLSENVSQKLMSTVSFSPIGINGIITSWLSNENRKKNIDFFSARIYWEEKNCAIFMQTNLHTFIFLFVSGQT